MNKNIIFKINHEEQTVIDEILRLNEEEDGNIISLLQKIQEHYGFLPQYAIFYISEQLNIPIAEIFSVATFYTQFKFTPKGKYVITCCEGTACHVKGGPLILDLLENILGIESGETTKDEIFSLESVACLGCCAISPVVIINGQIHGNLTLKKIKLIITKLKKETKGK